MKLCLRFLIVPARRSSRVCARPSSLMDSNHKASKQVFKPYGRTREVLCAGPSSTVIWKRWLFAC
jgi:hypothetical protein